MAVDVAPTDRQTDGDKSVAGRISRRVKTKKTSTAAKHKAFLWII